MRLGKLALPVLLAGAVGCATMGTAEKSKGLEEAVKQAEQGAAVAIEAKEELPELPAGELLSMALTTYHAESYREAEGFFIRALRTGNLNDAGRALAYWHLGTAYNKLGDVDSECEAMSSFISVAEDVIGMRDERHFAVNEDGTDFVEGFELQRKLTQARTVLNSVWARRTDYFGRSIGFSVPVGSNEDILYFLGQFTVGCPPGAKAQVNAMQDGIYRATVSCGPKTEELYFYMLSDSQAE